MMKIQEMSEWLVDRGFVVERSYDSKRNRYEFIIEKNGIKLLDFYEYMPKLDPRTITAYQSKFLNNMVKRFEELEKEDNMNKTNHEIMSDYAKAIRDANGIGVLEIGGKRMQVRLSDISIDASSFETIIDIEGVVLYPSKEFEYEEYCKHDINICSLYPRTMIVGGRANGKTRLQSEIFKAYINSKFGVGPFTIEKVIFNEPATIVLWADGTKTVVKCQNDDWYDPEKGLAMAIAKKALGNKGNYFNTIKKWTDEYEEEYIDLEPLTIESLKEKMEKLSKQFKTLGKGD